MSDKYGSTHCPRCGWPVQAGGASAGDVGIDRRSAHRTSAGPVRYLRCVCGAWLVEFGDELAAVGDSSV